MRRRAADVIEVFNAKVEDQARNEQAGGARRRYGLPGAAGSDAHDPEGIGAAYLELPDFDGPADFLAALQLRGDHRRVPAARAPLCQAASGSFLTSHRRSYHGTCWLIHRNAGPITGRSCQPRDMTSPRIDSAAPRSCLRITDA